MSQAQPKTFLVLASYFKGERFIQQAHARGIRQYLLTVTPMLQKPWPRECLADVFAQNPETPLLHTLNTVSYLARNIRFDRIVALDDFDVETAASLREHLRIPGMGDTTARHFRDKLAMRVKAKEEGIAVPDFVHVLNHDEIRDFIARVPAPWMLKPRSEASATGITKIHDEAQLWRTIEEKGDRQSYFLLERFLPGAVYHCDSLISERKVVFTEAHQCGSPPFDVAHGGGIFTTRTLARGSEDHEKLLALNEEVITKLNLVRGASHTEFIKSDVDGRFYMLETSARVGGAHIADVVEAATGVNLWQEWANIEVEEGKVPYTPPVQRQEYAGLALTLAKQEYPDLSGYADPEVVYRADEKQHAGLIVRSPDPERICALVADYSERFKRDFQAWMPAPPKSAH